MSLKDGEGVEMLLWSDESSSPFKRLFKSSGKSADDAMVQYDDRWADFFDILPDDAVLAKMTDSEMCARFGMAPAFFDAVIPEAIRQWRISPSRSAINLVSSVEQSTPMGHMFRDIRDQTRVLASVVLSGAMPLSLVRSIKGGDRKPLKVSHDAFAATLTDEGQMIINDVSRFFKAWELRNRAKIVTGMIKLPKMLYRGVRGKTIPYSTKEVEGESGLVWHCRVHEERHGTILSRPFAEISETPILSFTSSAEIAKYFSFDEGFIVGAAPSDFTVVACGATDEALARKDVVSGRQEREWIVRIDRSFVPAPEMVTSRDRDFAILTNDEAGIEMIHHRTVADYVLDGRKVKAWFRYNSGGHGGRVVFSVDGEGWGVGRQTMKREQGFDPLPGPGRPAQKLVFSRTKYSGAKTEYYGRYEPSRTLSPRP